MIALRRPYMLVTFIAFLFVNCSFGAAITYAPVALPARGLGTAATFLLVMGVSRTVSRWFSGRLGDVHPARAILVFGTALSLAGIFTLGFSHITSILVLIAAALYGIGQGGVQTGAFIAMSDGGDGSNSSAISALWNIGIDLGSSMGGILLGLTAARYGYAASIWVVFAVLFIALPLFMRSAGSEDNLGGVTAGSTISR